MNEAGVAYVPADRHRFGLVLPFTHRRQPRPHQLLPRALRARHRCATTPRSRRPPRSGSPSSTSARRRPTSRPARCRAATSRRSSSRASSTATLKLLVLDQPTRGLDVGSIEFIHRQAIAKRDAGTAVLLVSAELDEVLEMSDRIAVMYRGGIVGDRRRADGRQERDRPAHGDRRRDREAAGARPAVPTAPPATPHEPARPADQRRAERPSLGRAVWAVARPAAISIVLALVVGAVVIWLSELLVTGARVRLAAAVHGVRRAAPGLARRSDAHRQHARRTTPLILGGLSVALGFKAGLFNIGAQGQFLIGVLGAVIVGVGVAEQPPIIAIPRRDRRRHCRGASGASSRAS